MRLLFPLLLALACTQKGTTAVRVEAPPADAGPRLVTRPPPTPAPDASLEKLQPLPAELFGVWRASGQLSPSGPRSHGMSWMVRYDFRADGTFAMTGYPPIAVQGRIGMVSRDGNRVRVLLTERRVGTSPWPDEDVVWELAADGKSFQWKEKNFGRELSR